MNGPAYSETITTEHIQSFEPIAEEELGNLVAAIGNHEAKALLLSVMEPKVPYSVAHLNQLMNSMQGPSPIWRYRNVAAATYCKRSFVPIGLVAEERIDAGRGTILGYSITDYGARVGKALAGELLTVSSRYPDFSLINILAQTKSRGISEAVTLQDGTETEYRKRAPIIRLKILSSLLGSEEPLRASDVVRIVGEDEHKVLRNLGAMADSGLLHYNSRKNIDSIVTYKVGLADLKGIYYRNSPVRQAILSAIANHSTDGVEAEFTLEALYNTLIESSPDFLAKKKRSLQAQILTILKPLRDSGALHQDIGGAERSQVFLDKDQKQLAEDLLNVIAGFVAMDPNYLARGRAKADGIISKPEAVKQLLTKARAESKQANSTSATDFETKVRKILASAGEPLDSLAIHKQLLEKGDSYSFDYIYAALRKLEKSGSAVRNTPKGQKSYWQFRQER